MRNRHSFAIFAILALLPLAGAQKKPLDHAVYDSWKSVRGTSLSHDGKWILYVIAPQEGDAKVEVKSLTSDKTYSFDRGGMVSFSNDSKFVVATIVPPLAETKKATKDKVVPADMPKNSLLILNLDSGEQTKIDRVTSFQLPAEDSGWFTYRPEALKADAGTPASSPPTTGAGSTRPGTGGARRQAGPGARGAGTTTTSPTGASLVLRNLKSNKELKLENVTDSVLSKDGTVLAYSVTSKDGKEDGVYWLEVSSNVKKDIFKGKGKTSKLALSDETKAVAVLTDRSLVLEPAKANQKSDNSKVAIATKETPKPALAVFYFEPKVGSAKLIAPHTSPAFPSGWTISENSSISFSEKGNRIFFGTAPKPGEEKKDETPDSEKVNVDVWTWLDKKVMPQQLLQASADQRKTFLAFVSVRDGKVMQVETENIPSATIGVKGEGDLALGTTDFDYRLESSWDEGYADTYVIDLANGKTREIRHRSETRLALSPTGKYIAGYEPSERQYVIYDAHKLTEVVSKIPTNLYNELADVPATAPAYGEVGWTQNDSQLLVYDAYDIWNIDPLGKGKTTSLTGQRGRQSNIRFRYVSTNSEAKYVDLGKPFLLSGFNTETKESGFFTENPTQALPRPEKLVFKNKLFSSPVASKDGSILTYTQQDYVEYPDVWVAQPDFSNARKISNANPQQSQYNWGKTELVNWVSGDGQRLQGILIKPENFTYGKKYPMVTYFYERSSDTLNAYHPPAPSASTINLTYFPSNGYIVFVPDIPYKTGYPGESSVSAIVSGVLAIVNRGYVDPERLGIQGQSWGGYEVAYLVTRTNLFKCACSGAAVADMFSAYGGIRYGTGILRQGQYEHGQSRIGGNIWEKPLRYLENSPLFWLDKVETPLLMMHNDKDGAVPFTQGIELFSGLRRLSKPAWMCVYNGEDHNLVERKNRKDWSVRLSQFFDHFLMDKPMPIWMSKGIPATQKGKTYGFDLDTTGN